MDLRSGGSPSAQCVITRRRRASSLARKYSIFTALLLGWVAFIFFAYDLRRDNFNWGKVALLTLVVVLVAGAIARFTSHLLARPLMLLEKGITAVREGRLEPVPVSRTGDEIEYLGESLNEMIAALKGSRREVVDHQELLEARIRLRTEALEEATQRALAASKAKSEFLANISHELRTPMSGVLGMLDIVLDDELTPDQREHLEIAKSSANTLLALLNDILDLSKIEAGRMVLEKIPFDVKALAQDCVRSMTPRCRQKGIAILASVSGVPPQVVGDPLRIRQILNNLLSNAVKFTERGAVELRLSAGKWLSPSELMLLIDVVDTGAGIPEDKRAAIFEEFTQADGSISRKFGGTGLGLAITRRLVEMHNGSITVESEVGRGSRFRVELPCEVAGRLQPHGAEQFAAAPAPESGPSRGAWRILVAEDNKVNQKVVTAVLRKNGYQVCVAGNGRETLERLREHACDLVLMDIQMPEMDGLQAARLIRSDSRWKELPIIAMTAHAMNGDRERCLEAGMNGYLSKPVTPGHLLHVVGQYLRAEAPQPPPASPVAGQPAPIDRQLATRLMENDADLICGMAMLFLQLAPERLQKLHSAAVRMDSVALRSQAQRIERAAERIAASEVARAAAQLIQVSTSRDYAEILDQLAALECEISRLDHHIRDGQERAPATLASSASA